MGPTITRIVKFIRKGEKGDAAVTYSLVASANSLSRRIDYNNGVTITPGIVTVRCICTTGEESEELTALPTGFYTTFSRDGGTETTINYASIYAGSSTGSMVGRNYKTITFKLYNADDVVLAALTIAVADSSDSAVLRGPQSWEDCAVGYAFMAGDPGERYMDVVEYNGYYYICSTAHTKSATNYPGSDDDTNFGLWTLGDRVDLIATKILLAQYALVKNLGVEVIDMKDSNGNILFRAKDGVVTCKTGSFENVTVKGNLYRPPFVIDDNNCDTYAPLNGHGIRIIDIAQTGLNVELLITSGDSMIIDFPSASNYPGAELTVINCSNSPATVESVIWGPGDSYFKIEMGSGYAAFKSVLGQNGTYLWCPIAEIHDPYYDE